MSKEAALRAMREARYNQRAAGATAAKKTAGAPVRPARAKASPAAASADPVAPSAAADTADELCGHRSMNGRSCTREQGHAAKSHRYS